MSEQPKMVKVKLLKSVQGYQAGDVIEVPEEQAKQMTTVRQVHNGSSLQPFQTAELAENSAELQSNFNLSQMTVKDMADLGMKNVVETPKGMSSDAHGVAKPKLSTTTNEAIPHQTGAPMASVAIKSMDQEDMSSDKDSAGYDGANILSHAREADGKIGKAHKSSKAGNAPSVGSTNVPSEGIEKDQHSGVVSKVKDAVHKATSK